MSQLHEEVGLYVAGATLTPLCLWVSSAGGDGVPTAFCVDKIPPLPLDGAIVFLYNLPHLHRSFFCFVFVVFFSFLFCVLFFFFLNN